MDSDGCPCDPYPCRRTWQYRIWNQHVPSLCINLEFYLCCCHFSFPLRLYFYTVLEYFVCLGLVFVFHRRTRKSFQSLWTIEQNREKMRSYKVSRVFEWGKKENAGENNNTQAQTCTINGGWMDWLGWCRCGRKGVKRIADIKKLEVQQEPCGTTIEWCHIVFSWWCQCHGCDTRHDILTNHFGHKIHSKILIKFFIFSIFSTHYLFLSYLYLYLY